MDSIVCAALEEICAQGSNGISLPNLWTRLQNPLSSAGLHPCNGVKQAIWTRILNIPGLQFGSETSSFLGSRDPSIQSAEESEKLGLKIFAAEHLRDSFVGLYDLKAADAGISPLQRRTLERLAIARTTGITQSELAKEFGVKGNNIFYIVRNLECRNLIVRQSTIVRTKESGVDGENGMKSAAAMKTNLIRLYRYAKHLNLGSQQRLEITKPDVLENVGIEDGSTLPRGGVAGESVKDDVFVRDYLPALKAVCDKLEEANGKVLVVSDIKQSLGYRKAPGHRAWRNICNRLKDARLVEEFRAEVNNKVVSCLRLLKKFDAKEFQPKTVVNAYDDFDTEQPIKCGKRGQITEQLVELPIEHQIYDMIDAEGSKGITVAEVCRRLGLNSRRNYTRLLNMFSRFGMHLQAESNNKSVVYRVWTFGNFNHNSSNASPSNCKELIDENEISTQLESSFKDEFATHDQCKVKSVQMDLVPYNECTGNDVCEPLVHKINPLNLDCEIASTGQLDMPRKLTESDAACSETPLPISSIPSKFRGQRYPCLALTAISAQREQRILERLQDEKFILTVELHRWLEDLEKDNKPTTMDRKTLTRLLKKLQQQGQCKCVPVSVPVVTNCGRSRTTEVVLHPSVGSLSPQLLGQIHERLRHFDMQSRGQGVARLKNDQSVPVLTDVKRTSNRVSSDASSLKAEYMRTNGFVPAKMVRAKLLHNFLWSYISSLPDWNDALSSGKHGYDLKNCHSTCKLFALDAVLKAMPLELFLQVVGSAQKNEDFVESCWRGLCLFDLPAQEYKSLMDTQATGRLSWIIDILRRLKLIRLVTEGEAGVNMVTCAVLTHAMELKPYIEEPLSRILPSSTINSSDLWPRTRHDFVLSNREAVDEYWKNLEYYYAAADHTTALHTFPGAAVHEVFLSRSWASVRVMTAHQRTELLKRVANDDPGKKIPFKECLKIARDLNLTLEQVLHASYDKRRSRRHRSRGDLKPEELESHQAPENPGTIKRKRKRTSEARSAKHAKMDIITRELSMPRIPVLSDTDVKNMEQEICCLKTSTEDLGINLQACGEDTHANAAKEIGVNLEGGEDCYSTFSQCAFSRPKPTRRRKFSWTENFERQLVIQYARHRAALGAKYNRADWASVPDLPALPETCRRRMSILNSNLDVRRAVLKLCNLLGERYAKDLGNVQKKKQMSCDIVGPIVQELSLEESLTKSFDVLENSVELDSQEYRWDDFENENVKLAVDDVFRYRRMARLETPKRVVSRTEKEWPDLPQRDGSNLDAQACSPQERTGLVSSSNLGEGMHNHVERRHKGSSGRRSSCHRFPRKFFKLLNNENISVDQKVFESVAVSNVVELLKVVFLSASAAPEVSTLLTEILRRYSEHDLRAAFKYLKEKKFMVTGYGSQPFVLSQQFWNSASSSPFPINTGKRAASFANWLRKREKDLIEDGINLSIDLQCGEILHLFALVSSGELFISPSLPNEGVGETVEISLRRKAEKVKSFSAEKVRKPKPNWTSDGEFCSRREKGFPGIMVSISRATMSRVDAVELFTNKEKDLSSYLYDKSDQSNFCSDMETSVSPSLPKNLSRCHNVGNILVGSASNDSLWEAITSYAELLSSTLSGREQKVSFYPELFKTLHIAIHNAGEEGLNIEEVSRVMVMQGVKMSDIIVDVLQMFGLVVKVNAYDCVRVVDASYGPKYFLGSITDDYHDGHPAFNMKPQMIDIENSRTLTQQNNSNACNLQKETNMNLFDGHKITNLGLPDEGAQRCNEAQQSDGDTGFEDFMTPSGDKQVLWPILPWLNGDGSTNTIVFKALTRRVLGTVMQNPG
ncbi:uncharacterized protein LOC143849324 isoform X2 [Tasmannia lanceolata]